MIKDEESIKTLEESWTQPGGFLFELTEGRYELTAGEAFISKAEDAESKQEYGYIPWSLGPWTLDATCRVGLNCELGATLEGGASYTQNCNNTTCTTESVTGGGYCDITGGVDLLLQWYRRSGVPTGDQEDLEGEVEQNLTLTVPEWKWSQGNCGSEAPNTNKICVGEIRPDIKFTLPHIGKFFNHQWTLKFPYALYDGTPGC